MSKWRLKAGSYLEQAARLPCLREPSDLLSWNQGNEIEQENRRSVCFTGHRHLSVGDLAILPQRLDRLLALCYEHGYRDFFCGGAGRGSGGGGRGGGFGGGRR